MAVEYRLTLATDIPVEQVAAWGVPEPAERPRPTESHDRLSIGLYEQRGFWLSVRAGRDGYYDAEDGDGSRGSANPTASST